MFGIIPLGGHDGPDPPGLIPSGIGGVLSGGFPG